MATLSDPARAFHGGLLCALCGLLAPGCGEPLADKNYRGEPLAHFQGIIGDMGVGEARYRTELRTAVFWSPDPLSHTSYFDLIEQPSTGQAASVPSQYTLNFFEPPGPEHLATGARGARYGVGLVLLYADTNGNLRHDPSEPFIGESLLRIFLYAPLPLAAEDTPLGRPLAAGFRLVFQPLLCGQAWPNPASDGNCGVPLGAPCARSSDCTSNGLCLTGLLTSWPGQSCVVTEPPPMGCRPAAAAYLPLGASTGATIGHYVKACQTDADCGRTGYVCDEGAGGCLPALDVQIRILRFSAGAIPFCAPSDRVIRPPPPQPSPM